MSPDTTRDSGAAPAPGPGPAHGATDGATDSAEVRRAIDALLALPAEEREGAMWQRHGADDAMLRAVAAELTRGEATRGRVAEPPTVVEGPRSAPPDTTPGRVLGRRWKLGAAIGQGGQGVVCEAEDLRFRETAVVKLVRDVGAEVRERIRRETAALRWLRIPGVVRFLDSGTDGADFWVATERVRGTHFPGDGSGLAWSAVQPLALGLLEALGRIHAQGVVHGDIKPANVLVDEQGRVVLLDLGLAAALGVRFGRDPASTGGTLGYAAPELLRGGKATQRSDLYACGVLLLGAMQPDAADAGAARPDPAPPDVVRALQRMAEADPERRTASAAEALAALRAGTTTSRALPWTARELRCRFAGFDRFLHLREDAARELFRRTGGEPEAVEHELGAWLRSGLAHTEAGLVRIDRIALERLAMFRETGGTVPSRPSRARTELVSFARALTVGDARRTIDLGLRVTARQLHHGRVAGAFAALEEVADAARACGDTGALRQALLTAADAATQTGELRDFERARWLADRSPEAEPEAGVLSEILGAAVRHGRRDGDGGLALLETRPEERAPAAAHVAWRIRVVLSQARGLACLEATVEAGTEWARVQGDAQARISAEAWRAQVLYRTGRCAESLALRERLLASAGSPGLVRRRLAGLLASAMAAGAMDAVAAHLPAFERASRRDRVADSEALAWEYLCSLRFRRRDRVRLTSDDLEAVVVASDVRHLEVRVTLVAAIAWRTGQPGPARRLLDSFGGRDADLGSALATALSGAISGNLPEETARRVIAQVRTHGAPAVRAQILALLSLGCAAMRSELRDLHDRLALPADRFERERLREFMSLDEAAAVLRGEPLAEIRPRGGGRRPRTP